MEEFSDKNIEILQVYDTILINRIRLELEQSNVTVHAQIEPITTDDYSLENGLGIAFLAEFHSTPAGYVHLLGNVILSEADTVSISTFVSPKFGGSGIATKLTTHVENWLREHTPVSVIRAGGRLDNLRASKRLERIGYTVSVTSRFWSAEKLLRTDTD